MDLTHLALLTLFLFWTLQIAGSWVQWRHYRNEVDVATDAWSDGFLGVGQARPRFGAGAVALLAVGPDLRVRQLRTMSGLSVFARFKPDTSVQNLTLSQLGAQFAPGPRDTTLAQAIRQAITQVEEVRRRKP